LILIAALSIGLVTACENTARGLQQDAVEAERARRDERAHADRAARELGREARRVADDLDRAASAAAKEFAARAAAAATGIDVKAALMSNPSVDGSRIDVETDHRSRTVKLHGAVGSDAERTVAEAVARREARGYRIVNDLAVRPREGGWR
jgi:osmotically-inducible protein OsmY